MVWGWWRRRNQLRLWRKWALFYSCFIGLEFSLSRLKHIFAQVALGGAFQVGGTILVTIGCTRFVGMDMPTSVFYGLFFALSSTAIMLRALSERDELNAPWTVHCGDTDLSGSLCCSHGADCSRAGCRGRMETMGADVGKHSSSHSAHCRVAHRVSIFVPRMFRWVERSRSNEVFLLAVLSLCIGTAWLTSWVGMSLALVHFWAGWLLPTPIISIVPWATLSRFAMRL